ncbi:whey acidic protein-like [Penaeus japonicus]|uniref:whey acidic protein-like n=1 Tax=Penaeus japonicus TaxID=27405 RepID=UPI001C71569F|nr:whey acidic protein-like [Penaeus japonicus]
MTVSWTYAMVVLLVGFLASSCEGGDSPIIFPTLKEGRCPLIRDECPPVRITPPTCIDDASCSGDDKCCFDICLKRNTCKPPSAIF